MARHGNHPSDSGQPEKTQKVTKIMATLMSAFDCGFSRSLQHCYTPFTVAQQDDSGNPQRVHRIQIGLDPWKFSSDRLAALKSKWAVVSGTISEATVPTDTTPFVLSGLDLEQVALSMAVKCDDGSKP